MQKFSVGLLFNTGYNAISDVLAKQD